MKEIKINQNRDFKGVWIPKEIWLNQDLSWMEKLFLVEIHSLDNEDGCFASNAHFADFFGVSKVRCSQIITSLSEKKYINVELIYEGKQIIKRIIKIMSGGYSENKDRGIKYSKGGIKKTLKVYNTINNTNINKNYNKKISADSNYCETFEIIWKNYPNKKGKAIAYKKYLMAVKKYGKDEILNRSRIVIEDYNIQINRKELETKYIPHLSTFFNQERYQDWEVIEEQNKPKRLTKNQMAG